MLRCLQAPHQCRDLRTTPSAPDFYDSLTEAQKPTWQDIKEAFLERFGRSAAQRWNDMNMLWSQTQGDLSVDDFVARLTRLAKRLPTLDDGMLKHAVIRGFKPHIRTHVLQANVQTMTDLLLSLIHI